MEYSTNYFETFLVRTDDELSERVFLPTLLHHHLDLLHLRLEQVLTGWFNSTIVKFQTHLKCLEG